MLRISTVDAMTPDPNTVLGWDVADIGAAIHALRERGVAFERFPGFEQDALAVWSSPGGARVAGFRDPDGTVLSLTRFP
jgi:hypothetical protein